jgi:hypothetical protein
MALSAPVAMWPAMEDGWASAAWLSGSVVTRPSAARTRSRSVPEANGESR